jgi:RNA-directed DNA polymerase
MVPAPRLACKVHCYRFEGIIGYFHYFWNAGMRPVWNQLNHRLLKWVKWEKGLFKYASLRWLRARYKENPGLFAHWKLVRL